jgi:heme-degrading monooxygenase HmoA
VVVEHAVLPVRPGEETEFEAAFAQARPLIEATPGFVGLRLLRGVERPSDYLLLVEWERLEDHTEGFRGSDRYSVWSGLLHAFYAPFPVVEHFTDVAEP